MAFEPDGYPMEQGALADDIYFIESGTGFVVLEAEAPALAAAFHYEIARALADRLQGRTA